MKSWAEAGARRQLDLILTLTSLPLASVLVQIASYDLPQFLKDTNNGLTKASCFEYKKG